MSTRKTLTQRIANLENERATLEQSWRAKMQASIMQNYWRRGNGLPSHPQGYNVYLSNSLILEHKIQGAKARLEELPK